ncbi:MAG: hypothetical protein JST47_09915 [Bacteroidetes bacterium]|nr:hypothetical protein [Bacteroidota bacterium]MBS1972769.1 hypothetical protein [Bacteroidota bacterium]
MAPKKFKNIQALEKEILRLKMRAKQLEGEFDINWLHLQENYIPMALNSVLPKKMKHKGIAANIISLFLEHERFRNTIIILAEELIDRASDGIEFLSQKLKRKKNQ